jgi:hypothetical protein
MRPGLFIETTVGRLHFSFADDLVTSLDTSSDKRNIGQIRLLLESWMCLLADSPLNRTSKSEKPAHVFREWSDQLTSSPLKETIVRCSNLAHRLVSQPTIYGSGTSTGDWIPEMKGLPIFREYHHWYKTGDAACLGYVYNFLTFVRS